MFFAYLLRKYFKLILCFLLKEFTINCQSLSDISEFKSLFIAPFDFKSLRIFFLLFTLIFRYTIINIIVSIY